MGDAASQNTAGDDMVSCYENGHVMTEVRRGGLRVEVARQLDRSGPILWRSSRAGQGMDEEGWRRGRRGGREVEEEERGERSRGMGRRKKKKERKTIEQFDPRWVLSLSLSLCLQHVGMAGRVWGRVVIG
jgi:hypothetical protein